MQAQPNNIGSRVKEKKKEILRWQSWGRTKKLSTQIGTVNPDSLGGWGEMPLRKMLFHFNNST